MERFARVFVGRVERVVELGEIAIDSVPRRRHQSTSERFASVVVGLKIT